MTKRAHKLQISPALLIMKKRVPDVLAEIPIRALEIDWKGEESLILQEECLILGWHFFYKGVTSIVMPVVHKFLFLLIFILFFSSEQFNWFTIAFQDKIYPVYKFLLQRNVRVQFLNIVKMHEWCDALSVKLEKSLANLGYDGEIDKTNMLCLRDVSTRFFVRVK